MPYEEGVGAFLLPIVGWPWPASLAAVSVAGVDCFPLLLVPQSLKDT